MNRELCFCIEGENLYLEQVLVDYLEVPVFFLCRDEKRYYAALCTDMEELSYIVVHTPSSAVYDLLHGKIPMRDIILRQKKYWNVFSGEEIQGDIVTEHDIEELDDSVLPEENACFKILTEEMDKFVREFDRAYLSNELYNQSIESSNWTELSMDITFDPMDFGMDLFEISVAQEICQVKKQAVEIILEERHVEIPDYCQLESSIWSGDEALNLAA